MQAPTEHPDERARLAELCALGLLDTPSEERFDRVTRLAQRLFDVPIALVSLVDADRQWFKSNVGLGVSETPREISFCGHAILSGDVTQICDATVDERFADNPLVTGEPRIRFYAGCPITGPGGLPVGTLCIIDRRARSLSEDDLASLRDLAGMVEREFEALHLASVDQLTGLANRRGFESIVSKILAVCGRHALGATLMYLDLEGFKDINDRMGHEQGDVALREFAELLQSTFRTSDVVARLGGDEFGVLLSQSADPQAASERLRCAIDTRNHSVAPEMRVEPSIGWATFDPTGGESFETLLHRADEAMYRNKRSRRTRCGTTQPVG